VLALRAGLRAAHPLGDEEGLQVGLAHRARGPVRAADGDVGGHAVGLVGRARVVVGDAHDLVRDAARMREADTLLAEAGDDLVLDPLLVEAVDPEPGRVGRDREHEGLELVGAALAHPPGLAVGERGQQRARVALPVAVVEVVDRDLAVEEDGLLDAPETEQPDVEVVVLLRPSDAEGQVVGTADRALVGHRTLSSVRSANTCTAFATLPTDPGRWAFFGRGRTPGVWAGISSPSRPPPTRPAGARAPARPR
jgi:hypothetical protein